MCYHFCHSSVISKERHWRWASDATSLQHLVGGIKESTKKLCNVKLHDDHDIINRTETLHLSDTYYTSCLILLARWCKRTLHNQAKIYCNRPVDEIGDCQ